LACSYSAVDSSWLWECCS